MSGGDIFRSDLFPAGWLEGAWGTTDIRTGHSTTVFPEKGTDGKECRVSWDRSGPPHYTDQGVPKDHPGRHRDPR